MTPLPPLICQRCDREHHPSERHKLRVELRDWLRWKRRRIARRFRRA